MVNLKKVVPKNSDSFRWVRSGHTHKHLVILLLPLCGLCAINVAHADLTPQQQNFVDTYTALKNGDIIDTQDLKDYVLFPYLEYQRIHQHIRLTSDKALEDFIRTYDNTPMAEKLWTVWLGRMAMRQQWQKIIDFYKKDTGGIAAQCYFLQARIQQALKNNDSAISASTVNSTLDKARKLWLSGKHRPSSCNNLFALLKQKGRINQQTYWQRISLAMKKGNTRLARDLTRHLDSKARAIAKLWPKLRKNPKKFLQDKLLENDNVHTRQLILYGIKRLARKKTKQAKKLWSKFEKDYAFNRKEIGDVQSYLGVRDALDHDPYAIRKLASIPAGNRSKDANLWLARMAVRQGDWKKVMNAYQAMGAEQQHQDVWQYWHAHALSRAGKKGAANRIFTKLASDASFYGFLAADRLKLPYQRLSQKPKNWSKCKRIIAELDSIKRAVELFKIGMPELAKKEWFWTLKHLNKQGVLTAAAYAMEIGQPFLSILSVSATKDWNQVELRFPLKYRSLVENAAKQQDLTPAWVYGIMRRESAFDSKIVSRAKAQGLMQILPTTAQNVAKKLGIDDHKKSDLLVPEKNARLGSAYLSQLLKKFKGNYVKATAAYNAGPGRVTRWAPDFTIDAPRWIESIPFTETRKYVRAVMSYTTIYDYKLHHRQGTNLRLSGRLKPVGP